MHEVAFYGTWSLGPSRKRARYQEMAAEELVGFDKLRERLSRWDETKGIAQRELQTLNERKERIAELERDRDALLESYAGAVPEALESLEPEERHRVYEMLRLKVVAHLDGTLEARGILSGSLRVVQENGRAVCTNEGAS